MTVFNFYSQSPTANLNDFLLLLNILIYRLVALFNYARKVYMQGKRPLYLLLTTLTLLNLVATDLQAHEAQSALQAQLKQGSSVAFLFSSSLSR